MSDNTVSPVTISQFSAFIKQTLDKYCPNQFWICGEIYSMSERGGHCYIDLVEKAADLDDLVARIRCNIWRWNWEKISSKFYGEIGDNLRVGMSVQFLVQADYHALYSLSVSASDIEPAFTLGELQRRKIQVIAELRRRGLLDLNKAVPLPLLFRRIAVISSENAAGYTDFCHQLTGNSFGFAFSVTLFSSLMQGRQAEQSLCAALDQVAARASEFDIAVIIRGGGANSDLYVFDSLLVAEKCASLPLPLLSGIGHQRDLSIVDMVANTSLKTPTAVADFIINRHKQFVDCIDALAFRLSQAALSRLKVEVSLLDVLSTRLPLASVAVFKSEQQRLGELMSEMRIGVIRLVTANRMLLGRSVMDIHTGVIHLLSEYNKSLERVVRSLVPVVNTAVNTNKQTLDIYATKIQLLDPQRLLKKGYSFTTCNGVVLTDVNQLRQGDTILTVLSNGKVESTVQNLIDCE